MRARSRPSLITLCLCTVGLTSALAADPHSTVRWPLDQPALIGGLVPTVWGAPVVRNDDTGSWLQFDGIRDGLLLSGNPLAGCAEFTIEVLLLPAADGPKEQRFLHVQDERGNRALMETRVSPAGWALDTFLYSVDADSRRTLLDESKHHPTGRWTWVALVYANGHQAHFIDGAKELEGAVKFPPMVQGQLSLGVRQNQVYWFKGGIREVRFHPRALAAEELQTSP